MKISGTYTFTASPRTVWDALQNPTVLTSILPGCERLEEKGENQFEGVLDIKVGPVQGTFKGTIQMLDLVEPESFTLKMAGQGSTGFVNATARVGLEAAEEGTLLRYDSDAQIGGRIAGVGQRLLDSSARSIIQQSLNGFNELVQAADQSGTSDTDSRAAVEAAAAGYQPPSQSELAGRVARDVARESLPRPLLIGGAILLLLLLAYLLLT